MNTISLIGNLTKDPVEIADGKGVEMRVVYSHSIDTTYGYINVTAWARKAADCLTYLKYGDEIAITGELRYSECIDISVHGDVKRTEHKINAEKIDFLRQAKRGDETEHLAE